MSTVALRAFAIACGASAALTAPALAQAASDSYAPRFTRSEEDYSWLRDPARRDEAPAFKFIPLGEEGWLSLGGEYRYRIDDYDNEFNDDSGAFDSTTHQQRFYLHADLHLNAWSRVFVQLSAADQERRRPGPRNGDESGPDIAQAFVDLNLGEERRWRVRAGRQEILFGRFMAARDGYNLRRTFDGVRVNGPLGEGSIDAFAADLTQQRPGAFDDRPDDTEQAWGAAYTQPTGTGVNATVTYFAHRSERGLFSVGAGEEQRHSLALRLQASRGPWDFDGQAVYQFGDYRRPGLAELDISAFGFATETGYTFRDTPWRPRLAMRLDLASGDSDASDDNLGTFDLGFPNLTYISDATAFAARNIFCIQPFITVTPTSRTTFTTGVDLLWRLERSDAIYAPPGIPLTPVNQAGESFSATQLWARASWRPNLFVEFSGSVVHIEVDGALAAAGRSNETYAGAAMAWKF